MIDRTDSGADAPPAAAGLEPARGGVEDERAALAERFAALAGVAGERGRQYQSSWTRLEDRLGAAKIARLRALPGELDDAL